MTPSNYPKQAIVHKATKMVMRQIHWLTLACGHKIRVTGKNPPKNHTGCFKCYHNAKYGHYYD